jgi:hypothetical protein
MGKSFVTRAALGVSITQLAQLVDRPESWIKDSDEDRRHLFWGKGGRRSGRIWPTAKLCRIMANCESTSKGIISADSLSINISSNQDSSKPDGIQKIASEKCEPGKREP